MKHLIRIIIYSLCIFFAWQIFIISARENSYSQLARRPSEIEIETQNIIKREMELPIKHFSGINKIDKFGKKQGYWREISKYTIEYYFYKDGKKMGIARFYNNKNPQKEYRLEAIGSYSNDTCTHNWQFYDAGILTHAISKISLNTDFMKEAKILSYDSKSTLQSYCVKYNNNGCIRGEGWCISPYNNLGKMVLVGIWKYYTPNGIKFVDESLSLKQHMKSKYD